MRSNWLWSCFIIDTSSYLIGKLKSWDVQESTVAVSCTIHQMLSHCKSLQVTSTLQRRSQFLCLCVETQNWLKDKLVKVNGYFIKSVAPICIEIFRYTILYSQIICLSIDIRWRISLLSLTSPLNCTTTSILAPIFLDHTNTTYSTIG